MKPDKRASVPALSRMETLLLSVLVGSERYGLEIVDAVKKTTGQALSLGSLYVTLHRMEEKGLVKSRWGDSTSERRGARRRYYQATGLGERAFGEARRALMAAFGARLVGGANA